MKQTIILVDPTTNKQRKFMVNMDLDKMIPFIASEYMKRENPHGVSSPIAGVYVQEIPNQMVHPSLRHDHSIPKYILDALEVGDVLPYYSTVSVKHLKNTLDGLGVKVETCDVPLESSRAFGAVKVIEIKK